LLYDRGKPRNITEVATEVIGAPKRKKMWWGEAWGCGDGWDSFLNFN